MTSKETILLVLPSLLLALEAVILSLPDMHLAMRRMASGALIMLLGVLAAGALAAMGALAARYGRGRARLWLVLALVLPWVVVRVVPSAPREASPTGAYVALREAVLTAAAR